MKTCMKHTNDEAHKKNITVLRYGPSHDKEPSDVQDELDSLRADLLSVSELAKYSRITRSALIFYDNMGLVSPVWRGDNNYRYYSPHQVTVTNLINTLQELGVPLKEIIRLSSQRTPEEMISLFSEQGRQIDRQMEELVRAQKLLLTLKGMIEEGSSVEEDKIDVRWHEEEPILIGPENDYSNGGTIEEALFNFYKYWNAIDIDMDLNYPVWAVFSEERIKNGDWGRPDRFYFKTPDGPDRKPAGLYVTGHARGYYGQSNELYKKLIAYIDENWLRISGPAYEMYLLNEISIPDPHDYLVRISINVSRL